jgi:hypothetical protein
MANSLSSLTAGVGGVQISSVDTSGSLDIKSGTTTIVSITSAGAAVTGTLSSTSGALNGTLGATTPSTGVFTDVNTPNTFGFKNRIINGAMVIDQRNAGASVTNTGSTLFYLDRWNVLGTSSAGQFSIQQVADAPAGFVNSAKMTVTTVDTSLAASDRYIWMQRIEGYSVSDFGFGTANAKTVTVSFWVKSSLTGTFGGALDNGGTRSYPFSYTISAANTWEQKTVTIAGDTSGTWPTNNSKAMQLIFSLGAGSDYVGTINTWAGASYYTVSGATNVLATSGATFYITGVQLEKGSTATSFDVRDYGRELAMCQRYFYNTDRSQVLFARSWSNGVGTGLWKHLQVMRATPTITMTNYGNINTVADTNAVFFTMSSSATGSERDVNMDMTLTSVSAEL